MKPAQPGSIAYKLIAHLLRCEPDTELRTSAAAQAVNQSPAGFSSTLGPSVRAGLLACRKLPDGSHMWRLGPALNPGATARATWAEGDDAEDEPLHPPIVGLPANAVTSIFAMAEQRNAAPFAVALSTDGRLRFERHGRLLLELTFSEAQIARRVLSEGVAP